MHHWNFFSFLHLLKVRKRFVEVIFDVCVRLDVHCLKLQCLRIYAIVIGTDTVA